MLAVRPELVNSTTKMMVASEVYAGEASVDLSEEELTKGLKTHVAVVIQVTSDDDFGARYSV